MNSFIYIDNNDCLDPATNLAMEEYALRHLDPEHDYLMLYRNEPAVVIGRNQNILEEINECYVRKKNIHVLRRLSGGGTVYHDHGNLNFSFITRYEQSKLHNFRLFNAPVVKILRSLGIPAEMNDRNDILAGGRKISGNAQFSSRGRMFSHGTLLFNSRLEEVGRALTVRKNGIQSRSHKSVRSAVANISEFIQEPIDIHQFQKLILKGLRDDGVVSGDYHLSDADRQEINKIREKRYSQWEWNIGRSPKFQLTRSGQVGQDRITIRMEVDKGIIQTLSLSGDKTWAPELSSFMASLSTGLTGLRYDLTEIDLVLRQKVSAVWLNQFPVSDFLQLIWGDEES